MFVSTDAFREKFPPAPAGVAATTPGGPCRHRLGSAEPPLITVGIARARKMNPVKTVSKEVAAGGKCR
jgi:hypothetical protein